MLAIDITAIDCVTIQKKNKNLIRGHIEGNIMFTQLKYSIHFLCRCKKKTRTLLQLYTQSVFELIAFMLSTNI